MRLKFRALGYRTREQVIQGRRPQSKPTVKMLSPERMSSMQHEVGLQRVASVKIGIEEHRFPKVAHDRQMVIQIELSDVGEYRTNQRVFERGPVKRNDQLLHICPVSQILHPTHLIRLKRMMILSKLLVLFGVRASFLLVFVLFASLTPISPFSPSGRLGRNEDRGTMPEIDRRIVLAGAWAVPVIVATTAAPAFASSQVAGLLFWVGPPEAGRLSRFQLTVDEGSQLVGTRPMLELSLLDANSEITDRGSDWPSTRFGTTMLAFDPGTDVQPGSWSFLVQLDRVSDQGTVTARLFNETGKVVSERIDTVRT